MSNYPQYIQVGDKKYRINTDYRVALRCNSICMDNSICELECQYAIIYLLLGDEALEDYDNHPKLLELIIKYLNHGKELEEQDDEPSMDFEQDEAYIKASFMSDYRIDISSVEMHWWEYLDLLSGLTEHSALNRVRAIREEPLENKKGEELERWKKLKSAVALEAKIIKTDEQKMLDEYWENAMRKE